MSRFDHIFSVLAPEEKARIFNYAEGKGYIITTIADEVASVPVIPIEVIPAAEIPRSHFAHLDDATFAALKDYYTVAESKDMDIYPPLGYTPSVSEGEKVAASFLSYMLAVAKKRGIEEAIEAGYPLIETPKSERPTVKSRLTSLFS